jgi:hypothetical protein
MRECVHYVRSEYEKRGNCLLTTTIAAYLNTGSEALFFLASVYSRIIAEV